MIAVSTRFAHRQAMNRSTVACALLCLLIGCSSGPRGRIMSNADQDYVGNRAAGAAEFDRLISGAVERLLKDYSASNSGLEKMDVVVLGVENQSSEELGDWQEQIYSLISTSINRSDRYRTVSRRFIDEALRETRLRPEELFLPAQRRTFAAALERSGSPVDAIIFPKLTSGTTNAGEGIKQRNYVLELELVDVESGYNTQVSERLRKEYQS